MHRKTGKNVNPGLKTENFEVSFRYSPLNFNKRKWAPTFAHSITDSSPVMLLFLAPLTRSDFRDPFELKITNYVHQKKFFA